MVCILFSHSQNRKQLISAYSYFLLSLPDFYNKMKYLKTGPLLQFCTQFSRRDSGVQWKKFWVSVLVFLLTHFAFLGKSQKATARKILIRPDLFFFFWLDHLLDSILLFHKLEVTVNNPSELSKFLYKSNIYESALKIYEILCNTLLIQKYQ